MIKEFTLKNGLRVLHKPLPHLRTAALGLWIGSGSRHESSEEAGISHCMEHMIFKGSSRRTAADIAQEIDRLGGNINAFTAKDSTCFHTKTLSEDLPKAMEVVADMVQNPLLRPEHLELEKQVIIEEIGMVEDDPEELVQEMLIERSWQGHALSHPILGTKNSVTSFTQKHLDMFHKSRYGADNAVLAVAGDVDESQLRAWADLYFSDWSSVGPSSDSGTSPAFAQTFNVHKKKTEQAHLCLAFPGVSMNDEDVWPLMVLNNILGGGMGSRLFQRIREERGLVYSVYSYPTAYRDGGLFSVYAATAPKKANEVLKYIAEEIGRIYTEVLTEEEFSGAHKQLRGSFLMGLDSTNGHMMSMGRNRMVSDRIQQTEECLSEIDSITPERVASVSRRIFSGSAPGFAAVGNMTITDKILKEFCFDKQC